MKVCPPRLDGEEHGEYGLQHARHHAGVVEVLREELACVARGLGLGLGLGIGLGLGLRVGVGVGLHAHLLWLYELAVVEAQFAGRVEAADDDVAREAGEALRGIKVGGYRTGRWE